jgi:hypothetical protein
MTNCHIIIIIIIIIILNYLGAYKNPLSYYTL